MLCIFERGTCLVLRSGDSLSTTDTSKEVVDRAIEILRDSASKWPKFRAVLRMAASFDMHLRISIQTDNGFSTQRAAYKAGGKTSTVTQSLPPFLPVHQREGLFSVYNHSAPRASASLRAADVGTGSCCMCVFHRRCHLPVDWSSSIPVGLCRKCFACLHRNGVLSSYGWLVNRGC